MNSFIIKYGLIDDIRVYLLSYTILKTAQIIKKTQIVKEKKKFN